MSYVVFDIETGPLSQDRIREIYPPFDRSSIRHPGEFDPESVKYGPMKDPEKRAAKLEECRAKHAAEVADFDKTLAQSEAAYWKKIFDDAALSAFSGQILAIGYRSDKGTLIHGVDDDVSEQDLLVSFWEQYERFRKNDRQLVGFCIKDFDVPFIAQRSVILGINVPTTLLQNDRYLDRTFIDLRDRWAFGGRPSGSLNQLCAALGIRGKLEGVTGAMFAELYWNPETRPKAMEYLAEDVRAEYEVAERLL